MIKLNNKFAWHGEIKKKWVENYLIMKRNTTKSMFRVRAKKNMREQKIKSLLNLLMCGIFIPLLLLYVRALHFRAYLYARDKPNFIFTTKKNNFIF